MRGFGLALLLLLGGLACAQAPRLGSGADIRLDEAAPGNRLSLEVRTDPALTRNSELMAFVFPRDRRSEAVVLRHLVPPVAPGLYRLEFELPTAGDWGFSLRYGLGLDLYHASFSARLEPAGERSFDVQTTFRGDLSERTPSYVQPLGFGIFALVALTALGLITGVLRWLGVQRSTERLS